MARPAGASVNPRFPGLDRKEKLIAATERLLSSQGLGCVTTRDIARAAKVAEGALYHHFGDKAELILSVVLHQLGDFPDVLQSLPLRIGQNTDRKSTRLNSSHGYISYAVFCLKKKKKNKKIYNMQHAI